MIFQGVMALNERKPILLLPSTDRHPENEIDTRPLLALSHVCKYWRDISIGTLALWTRIHARHLGQMDTFLERSQPLPVTLFLDGEHQGGEWNGPLPEHMAAVVKAESPRLRRLDLTMLPTRDHVVPLLSSLHAPQLECLTIMTPSPGDSSLELVSWTPLLDDQASSLRALGLLPVVDWLPSSTFPRLTHLVLYFGPETMKLVHPFDLLRLLSNAPALEFLHVDLLVYDEPDGGTWQPPSEPISLPHLRSLLFTDCPYKLLSVVLPRLSLPEDVFIRLQEIIDRALTEGTVDPLPPLPIRSVTSLDVVMQGEQLLMVADGPTSGLWFAAELDLYYLGEPQSWGDWLLSLHECLTLTHVTHLHIYVDGWETFWPAFLAHLPQLTHLSALFGKSSGERDLVTGRCGCPTTVLCDALDHGTPMPCPALDTVMIEWPREVMHKDFVCLPQILDMLEARSEAGHPIRRVVVQVPATPSFDPAQRLNFFELNELIGTGCPPGTEYEVIEKAGTRRGLCAFEMREVWKVDGEDRYWEVEEREKPHYDLSQLLGDEMDY